MGWLVRLLTVPPNSPQELVTTWLYKYLSTEAMVPKLMQVCLCSRRNSNRSPRHPVFPFFHSKLSSSGLPRLARLVHFSDSRHSITHQAVDQHTQHVNSMYTCYCKQLDISFIISHHDTKHPLYLSKFIPALVIEDG